ncbi:MAG: hypothetical protein F4X51_09105 [Gemmatimonadetes bacterium]|nr:hypothetical protein [Gemmatimonadota bacterium]
MLFKLIREEQQTAFQPFMRREASALNLKEKDLENWMAKNPELLFGTQQVLVISQSVSGQRMADILALDAYGRLVIVEIKRDWSDRATVGQLLEYAANRIGNSYEDLERLNRSYWDRHHGEGQYVSLLERFQELTDDSEATKNHIPNGHRICIVAPRSDEGLCRIVEWLKMYDVPISFVPFTLYTDDDDEDILLEMDPLPEIQTEERNVVSEERDRFFNTNEKNAPGAYKKMFDQGVIAIYGYANGPSILEGSAADQRVFAYVSGRGLMAVGRIVDGQVIPGNTVFKQSLEYHVRVTWETIVADDEVVTQREVNEKFGYGLPHSGSVFCEMSCSPNVTNWIAKELLRRAGGNSP